MNQFDNLYNFLCETHQINEADGDLPQPPGMGAGPAAPAAPSAANRQMPTGNSSQNLPPISPEDNIDINQNDTEEKSALISQKKIQLIKLIASALATQSPVTKDGGELNYDKLHKLRVMLKGPTTEGDVKKKEDLLIKAIAYLQNRDEKSIARQLGYIDASPSSDNTAEYIPQDEYTQLVELARKALLSDPEKIAGNDRIDINASSIDSSNAEERLKTLKSVIAPAL